MKLDIHETYVCGNYTYRNFVDLSKDELLTILEWRNHPDIRKYMNNTEPIAVESHLDFVQGLRSRTDAYYWQVSVDGAPVGVLNIIDVDTVSRTCEPGFYLSPEVMGKGGGIFFLYNYKFFLLNELDFDRLTGHNYLDNLAAVHLTLFFGAEIVDIVDVNGRKSLRTVLNKTSFNKIKNHKLTSQFVRFVKNVDISNMLK